MNKKNTIFLFSWIDLDTYEKNPFALFNNAKEMKKWVKRYEKEVGCELTENEDYVVSDFMLDKEITTTPLILTEKRKLKADDKKLVNEALDILYKLEDKTGYKDKKIGKAIDLLQERL